MKLWQAIPAFAHTSRSGVFALNSFFYKLKSRTYNITLTGGAKKTTVLNFGWWFVFLSGFKLVSFVLTAGAVNWLMPFRCRWQIQQWHEQEETRSNAKRFKRAVRLCF